MTDLEQLTRELAMVKSRETDPLLELAVEEPKNKPEPRKPEGWVKDCLNGLVPVKKGAVFMPTKNDNGKLIPIPAYEQDSKLFGDRFLISDEDLARVSDAPSLINMRFNDMCYRVSQVMSRDGYEVLRSSVIFERQSKLSLNSIAFDVLARGVKSNRSEKDLMVENLGVLLTALQGVKIECR